MEKCIKFFIPDFIWQKIEKNPEFKKIVANINWLFIDKIIQMAVAFFVGIWMVRYLGPEKYGKLSYAIAFVALFGAFAKLGLESIVIKEAVKSVFKKEKLLGTTFVLRIFSGFLALSFSIISIFFFKAGDVGDYEAIIITIIISVSLIFQAFDVIDYWFQSRVASRFSVFARSFACIFASLIKIIAILSGASLLTFSWIVLLESFLVYFGTIIAYKIQKQQIELWSVDFSIAKELLKQSWPLMFSSIAIIVYMKIDQIMIGNMLGNTKLGVYSAAVVLCEAWYVIPAIIVTSVFPAIIYSQKIGKDLFVQRFQALYDVLLWIAILIAIPISLFSSQIIEILYGAKYQQADTVLSIYIWAGIFVFLNAGLGRYLVAENMTKVAFARSIVGAIANILLNLMFIPAYGIKGAAMATLISYGLATLSSMMPQKSRINFVLIKNSLNVFRISRTILSFYKK